MAYRIKYFGTALCVLFSFTVLLGNSAFAQAQTSVSETEATSVASQYVEALMQGDTQIVSSLLTGKALEKKSSMLGNPTYSQFLQKIYNNARYEVVGTEFSGINKVAVDVMITYSSQETSKFRLWLKNVENLGLRVFLETEISQ